MMVGEFDFSKDEKKEMMVGEFELSQDKKKEMRVGDFHGGGPGVATSGMLRTVSQTHPNIPNLGHCTL